WHCLPTRRSSDLHVVGGGGVDAGDGHDADVLGVGGGGRSADGGGQHRGHAVGEDRPAHVGVEVVAGHLLHGLDVAGVLGDEGDDGGQGHQDRREVELGGVEVRQAEPGGF